MTAKNFSRSMERLIRLNRTIVSSLIKYARLESAA